jgi:hypothetical protein
MKKKQLGGLPVIFIIVILAFASCTPPSALNRHGFRGDLIPWEDRSNGL